MSFPRTLYEMKSFKISHFCKKIEKYIKMICRSYEMLTKSKEVCLGIRIEPYLSKKQIQSFIYLTLGRER
jgi:hypothetical protein